jgi:hypothetical protein
MATFQVLLGVAMGSLLLGAAAAGDDNSRKPGSAAPPPPRTSSSRKPGASSVQLKANAAGPRQAKAGPGKTTVIQNSHGPDHHVTALKD